MSVLGSTNAANCHFVQSPTAPNLLRKQLAVPRRSTLTVRAAEEQAVRTDEPAQEASTSEFRSLNFTASPNAGRGFTESDSAGQTNIFAVEPKIYVQGSAADDTGDDAAATNVFGLAAGGVAAVAIGLGLVVLFSSESQKPVPAVVAADGSYLSLTAYKAKFQTDLAALQAPAVEVVEVVDSSPVVSADAVPVEAVAITVDEPEALSPVVPADVVPVEALAITVVEPEALSPVVSADVVPVEAVAITVVEPEAAEP